MITLRGHHLSLLYSYLKARKSEFSLENKKKGIISASLESGHSKKHGLNIINILERIANGEKVKMTDTIDDICQTCNEKKEKKCSEFIHYGISATCEDRGVLHFYGLQKRAYTSSYIQKRLLEKGIF